MPKRSINHFKTGLFTFAVVLCGFGFAFGGECLYRLVYSQTPISGYPDMVIDEIQRAGKVGYNGFSSCDWALESLEKQPQSVFDHYKRVKAVAASNNIEMIPWQYYPGMPAHEKPGLAEAFPVRETPFVVKDGFAKAYSDPQIQFQNSGFESGSPVPALWKVTGSLPVLDNQIKHSGKASVKYVNPMADSYLKQNVIGLKPFRAYELSVWIQTQGYSDTYTPRFSVQAGGTSILHSREVGFPPNGINPNSGRFVKYKADFNTLGHKNFTIRFIPTQSGATGTIWLDDVEIREVGLYETVYRPSCPIVVKSEDGTAVYVEGRDYHVDPAASDFSRPKLLSEGRLKIPAGSAISEGQKLNVSWYQYANVETSIPATDFCLPEAWPELQDNLDRIDQLFGNSNTMFGNLTEWRVGGWNANCEEFTFSSGGEYLAKSWSKWECMLTQTGNGCRTRFVWSDMFDPYHNSLPKYWASWRNGTFGAWHGLTEDILVCNWNCGSHEKMVKSLSFFKGKNPDHPGAVAVRQLVHHMSYAGQAQQWVDAMNEVEKLGGPPVVGMVWANWYGDHSSIGPTAEEFKTAGWWGTNPFPVKTCAPASTCEEVGINAPEAGPPGNVPVMGMAVMPGANRSCRVEYHIPARGHVTLHVRNIHGRLVRTLVGGRHAAGKHRVAWDESKLPAGVYFLRLQMGGAGQATARHFVY